MPQQPLISVKLCSVNLCCGHFLSRQQQLDSFVVGAINFDVVVGAINFDVVVVVVIDVVVDVVVGVVVGVAVGARNEQSQVFYFDTAVTFTSSRCENYRLFTAIERSLVCFFVFAAE